MFEFRSFSQTKEKSRSRMHSLQSNFIPKETASCQPNVIEFLFQEVFNFDNFDIEVFLVLYLATHTVLLG